MSKAELERAVKNAVHSVSACSTMCIPQYVTNFFSYISYTRINMHNSPQIPFTGTRTLKISQAVFLTSMRYIFLTKCSQKNLFITHCLPVGQFLFFFTECTCVLYYCMRAMHKASLFPVVFLKVDLWDLWALNKWGRRIVLVFLWWFAVKNESPRVFKGSASLEKGFLRLLSGSHCSRNNYHLVSKPKHIITNKHQQNAMHSEPLDRTCSDFTSAKLFLGYLQW